MEHFNKNNLVLILLIISASCIIFSPTLVQSACNAIDKEALLKFKSAIEYDSSGQLKTWNPNTDCCTSWNNVQCDNKTGRVIKLSPFRPSNPMDTDISVFVNGTISPFLGNLEYLQELNLNHFQQFYLDSPAGLRGPIPTELGQLSHLTHLSLAQNILIGTIPTSFSNLNNLETLDLGFNKLTGVIPASIFPSKKSLKNLYLEQNQFTGTIPSSIINLVSLENLNLQNNSLAAEIPTILGSLQNLEYVDLSSNKFLGRIPDSLSQLPKIVQLKLDHNELSGSIPANLLNLKNLQLFDVSSNQLSGEIPPHKVDFPTSSFLGNPGLCGAPLPPCKPI